MLPFTKRPGREEGDEDVSTREDVPSPSKPPGSIRPPKPSFSDDELTNLMPTKALGDAVPSARVPAPIPAAGRPATIPPPRSSTRPPASVPPPRSSARPAAMMDGEDDEGRTVVRGAPKIVKRGSKRPPQMDTKENVPTTLSPAAVIKQTLESAYAAKSERLMPPPPADLLPDPPEHHPADGPGSTVLMPPSSRSQPPMIQGVQAINLGLQQTMHASPASRPPPSAPHSYPPPPHSYPPPPQSYPPASFGAPVPSGSVSVPGMAMSSSAPMPAHFMNPQPPYSDGRMDPPGTSVTSRNRVVGRPAISWAAALLAFGLLVGVGAVAVMQGSADGLVDTTASFVDPARAGQKPAAAAQPAPAPQPVPQPVATETAAPQPPAPPPVAAAAPQPTVIAASPPPAPDPTPPAKADKPDKPEKKPIVRQTFRAAPAPAPRPAPAAAPAADDDTKTAAAAKPAKPAKASKGGGEDDETKKALEQLQKAQLESAQTF